MTDPDLNVLMRQLFRAQAYRCALPSNQHWVNTEGAAKDDGCDGWTSKPPNADPWLGELDTCWQFKAGLAGQPNKLRGEVSKPIPRETLANGGRFVVVATGSNNGKKGVEARLKVLTTEAAKLGLPTGNIIVIGSEKLTNWCNEHPAVAAPWAGRPSGLRTLEDWSQVDVHQVPWQSPPGVDAQLQQHRIDLDPTRGKILHLHIYGPPGVGKTRFALELCREAPWKNATIYLPDAGDLRLLELIDGAAREPDVQLVVVADEAQREHLSPLRDSLSGAAGRIRLITVGHAASPDPSRIPALRIEPLPSESMQRVIKGWHPAMPPEHVRFVARFADGFVKLARLAADAVARNPAVNVHALVSLDEIRGFLDGMLGPERRESLYVVAVLASVGWDGEMASEGQAIANHLGFDWNAVRADVERFHRVFGIASRGGRYRYISPSPLATLLAVEAWTTYPDRLKSLPSVLPTQEAIDSYYRRLELIASTPQTRAFARDQLAFFFRLADFLDLQAVRRWSALSAANPDLAVRRLREALQASNTEDRLRIIGDVRRQLVWRLVRLAWPSSCFYDAAISLALLAEAENETWGNNATGEFVARFQIYLGGTAVPYLDRLAVIDDLVATGRPALTNLALKALSRVAERHASRMQTEPPSDDVPEVEWQPATRAEYSNCVREAIAMMSRIALRKTAGIQSELLAAATSVSWLLRHTHWRDSIATFYKDVRLAYPETREPVRRIIADAIRTEDVIADPESPEVRQSLMELHSRFQDPSLPGRVHEAIGDESLKDAPPPDLAALARDLLSTPDVLKQEWKWLTSGEALNAWSLGSALAEVDEDGALASMLPELPNPGRDMRLICGYVSHRQERLGNEWFDEWFSAQFRRRPKPTPMLLEVAWRCGVTPAIVTMVASLLQDERPPPEVVGQLTFGRWHEGLSTADLERILRAMISGGNRTAAIAILAHRIKDRSNEFTLWEPLALELATSPELIRSGSTASYQWKQVVSVLIADHAMTIAEAIFREQANRKDGTWFAEHSYAAEVLVQCAKQDSSGVWHALRGWLEPPSDGRIFGIGFPKDVLDQLPVAEIEAWVAVDPAERGAIIAPMAKKDLSSDATLAAKLLGAHGDDESLANAFYLEWISGTWWGEASAHWEGLARSLEEVSQRTAYPKLRRWVADSIKSLRAMAERDREREEEEDLRY